MNRIFYYILLVTISGAGAAFVAFSSMSFADSTVVQTEKTEENKWYTVTTLGDTLDNMKLTYRPIVDNNSILPKNSIVLGEFGRLSSFIYLSQSGQTQVPLTLSGKTDIMLADTEGIISLYDLFSTYTIHSQSGEYRLEQITNGSFYIGKEKDGRLVIYAIDGVMRLTFLDKGAEMTSMILFPGSYIRFDPKRNAALKGADLFRTILSLQEGDNEIFEFVNPRVNTGNDQDTFFNYRLPLETRTLFRILSTRFHTQVENIDLLKSYGNDIDTQYSSNLPWLLNPTKKNHFMLLELKYLLSQVVKSRSQNNDTLVKQIAEIYDTAKGLQMESSTAKKTIEQFLLDGRFALYGDADQIGPQYQETYEKIARMIGIEPTAGKSRLLQNLADIYSGNLFLQSRKATSFRIDTYEPTAIALLATLDEDDIEQKDYFDIAIYAYNILDKIQDKGLLKRDYLENKSTYDYLITFFYAGSKYMNSIQDPEKKIQTIMGFSSQFYEKVLSMVVNSLYAAVMKDDNGALYIQEAFLNGSDIRLDAEFMKYVSRLEGVVAYVNDTVRTAFGTSSDTDVYIKIQKATERLKGLAYILDPKDHNENYKKYMESPYMSEANGDIMVPQVTENLKDLVRLVQKSEEITPIKVTIDPKIQIARTIFPDADIASFISDGQYLSVKKAFGYVAKLDGSVGDGFWNMVFLDNKTISQPVLQYNERNIEIKFPTDKIDLQTFNQFRDDTLKLYLDIIDANSDISGPVRIILAYKRVDIGDRSFVIR